VPTQSPYHGEPEQEAQATGLVHLDGTSYSGADIRAVVHVYPTAIGEKYAEKAEEMRISLVEEIDTINSKLQNSNLSNAKRSSLLNDKEKKIRLLQDLTDTSANIEGTHTKVLAEIQTLSVQTFREKFPVRALGATYAKSFTRGPRTVGGSLIFTIFDKQVLHEVLESHPTDFDVHNPSTTSLSDQLPPFDITIVFANELGQLSRMSILGVEIVSDGQVMSIHDILLEGTAQFVARDIDPMRNVLERETDANGIITSRNLTSGMSASDLLLDQGYRKLRDQTNPAFLRFKGRHNPFI